MTREERLKAINALKISAPIMAVTQEKFNDYIQTLNQIMDWLEQEPKSEWQKDHEILKAYSDGANEVLDKIRADLYKLYNDRPSDYNHSQRTELFCEVIKILDKYKAESEVEK